MRSKNGYDVFLGGSCGETSWRKDVVIPHLRRHGITYYDPQRDVWTPETIKKEERAKANSKVLLFVIDPGQANIVSFIEMAFLAAREAPLVVVLPSDDEIASGYASRNCDDRLRAVKFLRTVLNRHGVPQCRNVDEALRLIELVICRRKSLWDAVDHVPSAYVNKPESSLSGLCHFVSAATEAVAKVDPRELVLPKPDRKVSQNYRPRRTADWIQPNLLIIEILLFGTVCVSCPTAPLGFILGGLITAHIAFMTLLPGRWLRRQEWRSWLPRRKLTSKNHDVYLGCSGSELDWIRRTAVPVLSQNNLTYLDASCLAFDDRLSQLPFCRFVLYVVSCTDKFLSGLVELAYLMGTGNRVIGCITTNITPSECQCRALQCELTQRMAANYRRGLLYLREMAARSEAPVFDNVKTAVLCAAERIRASENGYAEMRREDK